MKEVIHVNVLFSGPLATDLRERLKHNFKAVNFTFTKDASEAKKHVKDAEVLVTYGSKLDSELIEMATDLKWVMVLSAGIDPLPADLIAKRNILVTNVRGIHKTSMSEYAISMILQVERDEKKQIQLEKDKVWSKRALKINEISGKTMLVLGTGAIGQEVARLAKAFKMKTYGISRSGREAEHFDQCFQIFSLKEVLPKADYVVSVLPSTKETKGLLTFEHFQLMKDSAIFLNMGRGDLVTSDDMIKAVQKEEIAHAILDVFEEEPLPEDHPLWNEERVTITPHISGMSPYYGERAIEIFEHNLEVFLTNKGEYKNQIDITRGY